MNALTTSSLSDVTRTVGDCVGAFEGDLVGGNVGLLCLSGIWKVKRERGLGGPLVKRSVAYVDTYRGKPRRVQSRQLRRLERRCVGWRQ